MSLIGIDDERDLQVDKLYRTGEQAIAEIDLAEEVEVLYMDHDLGEGLNGVETIKVLLEKGLRPKQVHIVSSNPVGRDNIMDVLVHDYGYKKLSPFQAKLVRLSITN